MLKVTHGMPLVMLFGKVFAYEPLVDLALVGTQGAAECILPGGRTGNVFSDTKELGEPTGFEAYDEMKQLTEAYCFMLFVMSVSYWL